MNYFIIYPDDKKVNRLEINLTKEELDTKEPFVTYAKINDSIFAENLILIKTLFRLTVIVSDELKEILELYIDVDKFVPIFVIDKNNYNNKVYWKVEIPFVDCIQDPFDNQKKIYNINEEKAGKNHIFLVQKVKATYVVVDLILMEHLIKRGFLEIKFLKTLNSNI